MGIKPLPKIEVPRNLRDIAYEAIKDHILHSDFDENYRLTESALAERMGISATPVKEALTRLETDGLIRVVPRRGAYVVRFSSADVTEIYEVREAIECFAGKLACANIKLKTLSALEEICRLIEFHVKEKDHKNYSKEDARFHRLLVQASGNERMFSIYEALQNQMLMIRYKSISLPGRPEKVYLDHKKILEELRRKDAETVERQIRNHIQQAKEDLIQASFR